jgi:hypothetical protein
MKKTLILVTLIAIAVISGYSKYTRNESRKSLVTTTIAGATGINNSGVTDLNPDNKLEKQTETTQEKPQILLILNNDTGMTKWYPSLWWNYQHIKSSQAGC